MAAFFLGLTIVPLSLQKEIPYHEAEVQPNRSLREQFVVMKDILVHDKAYRGFLIALIAASILPIAQIPLYTAKALHLQSLAKYHAFLGSWMTIALTLGAATFTPVLGYVADRFGCKRLGYLSYTLTLVSLILIMLAKNLPMVLAAILIAGFASGSSTQLTWNFPMEFAPENRRPSYLGLRSLWSVPFIFVPLLGGWIADHFRYRHGYDIVFVIAIGFTVLTLVLYKVLFPDPRQTRVRQVGRAASTRPA